PRFPATPCHGVTLLHSRTPHKMWFVHRSLHFFFLWLSNVDLALSRIRGRVSEGGHDVPEADVRRRFDRSIKNFLVLYRALADSWFLFDNSPRTPSVIALKEQGRLRIMKPDAYDTLVAQYGNPD